MELFTKVKQVLSQREDQIRTLDKSNEEITSLCRTLLDCVKQSMRNRPEGLSYDQKNDMTNTTKDLISQIDNEVKYYNKCQEQLMEFEDKHYDNREPEHVDSIELT
jgi:phosphoenolpyruvate synthase/pyruvate phosphate dikinase